MKKKDNNTNPMFSPMEYLQFRLSSISSKTFPEIVEEAGYDLKELNKNQFSDMFSSLALLKEVIEELCNKKELSEKFKFNIELIEINETETDLVLSPGQIYNTFVSSDSIKDSDTMEGYKESEFYNLLTGLTTCFVFYKKHKGSFKIFTTSILNYDSILDGTIKEVYEKVIYAKNFKNKTLLGDSFTNELPNSLENVIYFDNIEGKNYLVAGEEFLSAILEMIVESPDGRALEIYFRTDTEELHRKNREKISKQFKENSLLNIEQKVNPKDL